MLYYRYATDDCRRTTNDTTLKFDMHLGDTISDLHIEFQTSNVSTGEENHLRVCRKSRYLQNDFSILSDPISQKWFGPHLKPLNSAFQWYQPFEKIPTTSRDMNFRIQNTDFYEKRYPHTFRKLCDVTVTS